MFFLQGFLTGLSVGVLMMSYSLGFWAWGSRVCVQCFNQIRIPEVWQ